MSVCQFRSLTLAALLGSLFASSVTAAVFERDLVPGSGDGLLTFDDENQREWLDLTETQLFNFPGDTLEEQYQAVVAQTNPGGMFDDFTVAEEADVLALAESAGIDTSTTDFDTNQASADSLVSLLGDPILSAVSRNKWATGYLRHDQPTSWLSIEFFPAARSVAKAGISIRTFEERNGVWLYRPIPEPSSLMLALGIGVLHALRSHRRPF